MMAVFQGIHATPAISDEIGHKPVVRETLENGEVIHRVLVHELSDRIQHEPSPRLTSPLQRFLLDVATDEHGHDVSTSDEECDDAAFAEMTGDDLVGLIRSSTQSCLDRLFSRSSARLVAFQKQNMLDVAAATEELARSYDGTNSSQIRELYLFLRIGYFVAWYDHEHINWTFKDEEVSNAIANCLDAFVENNHFYDETEEHFGVLFEPMTLMDASELHARYVPAVKAWLQRWRPELTDIDGASTFVNVAFTFLFRGHQRQAFQDLVQNDVELIEILRDLALAEWMVGTDFEYLAENAGRELARFSQYKDAPIYSIVQDAINSVFERYDLFGFGWTIWIATASGVTYYDDCEIYDICGFQSELETHVLPIRHECSDTIVIRAEELSSAQLERACELLSNQEAYFHTRLRSDEIPVGDDHNDSLEIVVFADSHSYQTYSFALFGNDTNNGGIYLEGIPSLEDNVARFVAYVATWIEDRPIWNLEHEQIHYLDGRFNLYGGFGDLYVDRNDIVWWLEGLAEYLSLWNDNAEAVDIGTSGEFKLSEVFKTLYGDGQVMVYRWGYLAVRFMFERHRDDVDSLLNFYRDGNYGEAKSFLHEEIGTNYDEEWTDWLSEVTIDHEPIPDLIGLPRRMTIKEGFLSSYAVSLSTQPEDHVTVSIRAIGDHIELEPSSLTFTPDDWEDAKSVGVSASTDDDALDDSVILLHTASGGNYGKLRALVLMRVIDSAPTIAFVEDLVEVKEGDTATLELALSGTSESEIRLPFSIEKDSDPSTYDGDSADLDDVSLRDELVIAPGETHARIEIPIRDDDEIEPARENLAVFVDTSSARYVKEQDAVAIVSIAEGVCDRTVAVQSELRRDRTCDAVTPTDLADELILNLASKLEGGLQTGDFQGLTGVIDIRLYENELETLPPQLFADTHSLRVLYSELNRLHSLPNHPFRGSRNIEGLRLDYNQLDDLPTGIFVGLSKLDQLYLSDNPGSPFTLKLEWEHVKDYSVVATVSEGAPFDMEAKVSVTGGEPSMDTVVVSRGESESELLTVTPDGTGLVQIEFTTTPELPEGTDCPIANDCFYGLSTAIGPPLVITEDSESMKNRSRHELSLGMVARIPLDAPTATSETNAARISFDVVDDSVANASINDGHLIINPAAVGSTNVRLAFAIDEKIILRDVPIKIVEPEVTSIPYFPIPFGQSNQAGFLRIINQGAYKSDINIQVVDDDGVVVGTFTLWVNPHSTIQVDSENVSESLPNLRYMNSEEVWRLHITSGPALKVLAYIESTDGLLTSMHDVVPSDGYGKHDGTLVFDNDLGESVLRLSNRSSNDITSDLSIFGEDGSTVGEITIDFQPYASSTLSMSAVRSMMELRSTTGRNQRSSGVWRLAIEAPEELQVMNLFSSTSGFISNLSRSTSARAGNNFFFPLFVSGSDTFGRRSLLRIANVNELAVGATIRAFDDSLNDDQNVSIAIEPNHSVNINSDDLELGNPKKGIDTGIGSSEGDWRLSVSADKKINALSYIQMPDGFLASMGDSAERVDDHYWIPLFLPSSSGTSQSQLRLANFGDIPAELSIFSIDNNGVASAAIQTVLLARDAAAFSSHDLEQGHSRLKGTLGRISDIHQLFIHSDRDISVVHLVENSSGYIANLSSVP